MAQNNQEPATRAFEWPHRARMAVVVTCLLENLVRGQGPAVHACRPRPRSPARRTARRWPVGHLRRPGRGVAAAENPRRQQGARDVRRQCARASSSSPSAAAQIIRSGHEISAHSYPRTPSWPISARGGAGGHQAQRDVIKAVSAASGRRAGSAPCLRTPERTEAIVAETGYLWYGDYNNIDLPFCVKVGGRTIVALPHSDFADHRVLRLNPRDWYEVYKDTFDYLYQQRAGVLSEHHLALPFRRPAVGGRTIRQDSKIHSRISRRLDRAP